MPGSSSDVPAALPAHRGRCPCCNTVRLILLPDDVDILNYAMATKQSSNPRLVGIIRVAIAPGRLIPVVRHR
jgi:hypothetical protein